MQVLRHLLHDLIWRQEGSQQRRHMKLKKADNAGVDVKVMVVLEIDLHCDEYANKVCNAGRQSSDEWLFFPAFLIGKSCFASLLSWEFMVLISIRGFHVWKNFVFDLYSLFLSSNLNCQASIIVFEDELVMNLSFFFFWISMEFFFLFQLKFLDFYNFLHELEAKILAKKFKIDFDWRFCWLKTIFFVIFFWISIYFNNLLLWIWCFLDWKLQLQLKIWYL